MSYTQALQDLFGKLAPAEVAGLEACAGVPGQTAAVPVGEVADQFWAMLAELRWAERGEIVAFDWGRVRKYQITALGAKAMPVLLARCASIKAR